MQRLASERAEPDTAVTPELAPFLVRQALAKPLARDSAMLY